MSVKVKVTSSPMLKLDGFSVFTHLGKLRKRAQVLFCLCVFVLERPEEYISISFIGCVFRRPPFLLLNC